MPAARYSEELLGGYGCTGWLPGGQQAMSERGGPTGQRTIELR